MRAKAGEPNEAEVSPLETQYRQWFQDRPVTWNDPPEFLHRLPAGTRVIVENYTTYGAYDEPITE
jgi:hypothetical protein